MADLRQMSIKNRMPEILVTAQFTAIVVILLCGRVTASAYYYFIPELSGVLLGIWAITEQKPGNFNISPRNRAGARLITSGPYKHIRHPMYLAIILTLSPLIIDHFNYCRLIAGIILLAVLIIKLNYEELQLRENFPGYAEYAKKSRKLIPWVY